MPEQEKSPYQRGVEVRTQLDSDEATRADSVIMQMLDELSPEAYAEFLRGLLGHPKEDTNKQE